MHRLPGWIAQSIGGLGRAKPPSHWASHVVPCPPGVSRLWMQSYSQPQANLSR